MIDNTKKYNISEQQINNIAKQKKEDGKMLNKIFLQQGDLILGVVNTIPKEAKQIKISGSFIVLKGEGVNTHEITDCSGIEVYEQDQDGVLYLKTSKEVSLIHSEHGTTTLEPNKIYKRVIEREFNYEDMEARNTRRYVCLKRTY